MSAHRPARRPTDQLLGPPTTTHRVTRHADPGRIPADTGSTTARLLLTVTEAAERLGIGRSLMYELISTGQIASVHIGRLRRITPDALTTYVRALNDHDIDPPDTARQTPPPPTRRRAPLARGAQLRHDGSPRQGSRVGTGTGTHATSRRAAVRATQPPGPPHGNRLNQDHGRVVGAAARGRSRSGPAMTRTIHACHRTVADWTSRQA